MVEVGFRFNETQPTCLKCIEKGRPKASFFCFPVAVTIGFSSRSIQPACMLTNTGALCITFSGMLILVFLPSVWIRDTCNNIYFHAQLDLV